MRLNTLKPGAGSKKTASAWAVVSAPVLEKPVAVVTRVRNHVLAVFTR